MGGAERGCGTIFRGSGRTGRAAAGAVVATPAETGAAITVGAAGVAGLAGTAAAGLTVTCGWRASSSSSFFLARMAFITSPGLEMCDRSIFCTMPCGWRDDAPLVCAACFASCANCARTFSASSASSELECVLTPDTPTTGRTSIIARGFTSNSRARSLIRTLLIRLFSKHPAANTPSRSSLLLGNGRS